MNIQGVGLNPNFEGGREPVTIHFNGEYVRVECLAQEELNVTVPVSQLKISLGGNNGSLLFIEHPSFRETKVYSEFKGVLKNNIQSRPYLYSQIKSSYNDHQFGKRVGLGVILAFVALLALGVYFRSPIANAIVNKIPFSAEKEIADKIFARKKKNLEPTPADKTLAEVARPLLEVDSKWNGLLTVHISSGTEVNAYATIGGHIFMQRGLIEKMTTVEELLGVLAHEMTHAKERHVARSVFQGLGLFMLVQVLLGDVTGIVAVLADQGAPLLMYQHSRELESEADRLAVDDLIKAKIDPRGLVGALKILDQESKKQLAEMPGGDALEKLSKLELWSTHPEMERRISELSQYIEKHNDLLIDIKPIEFNYIDFVDSVRKSY